MARFSTLIQSFPPDPYLFWRTLHPRPRYGFILGSGHNLPGAHRMFMSIAEPKRVFRGNEKSGPAAYNRLRRAALKTSPLAVPRFVGFFGFGAGRIFDRALSRLPQRKDPLGLPLFAMGEFNRVVELDFQKRVIWIHSDHPQDQKRVMTALHTALRRSRLPNKKKTVLIQGVRTLPYPKFEKQIRSLKKHIDAGDIYQANYSLRFYARFTGDPVQYFENLNTINPSPYACLLVQDKDWLISCSPELLLNVSGRKIETRPIAGTRPRGRNPKKDRLRAGQLLLSPKERAEHIMLVDLERNDIGRVSVPGSVRVTESASIERYSHVMHIVSHVEGRLQKKTTAFDALNALFPGGTITGCPKIRSVQLIEEHEQEGRGPFYGSAGYFSWNGDAVFNILIRTAHIRGHQLNIRAGAGIVADSHPKREYREAHAKAEALFKAAKIKK